MSKKTKIKILVFFALIAAAMALPNKAYAAMEGPYTYDLKLGYVIDTTNKEAIISSCDESATNIKIPSTLQGYPVKMISQWAFRNCKSLLTVSIPTSVTSIDYAAFEGCTSLISVTIPNSVTELSSNIFSGCTALKKASLPNKIDEIPEGIFKGCTSLSSVTIPSSYKIIGNSAFEGCTSLKTITIPNNVWSLEEGVFKDCTSLENVTLSNVTSIGKNVFQNCKSLTDITLPNTVFSIGSGAFEKCTSLKSISMSNGLGTIYQGAFKGCTSLTTLIIPNSVKTIWEGAFEGCTNLTKVVIPASVTYMENNIFGGCTKVKLWVEKYSTAYHYAVNNKISYYVPLNSNVTNVRATSQTQNSINLKWDVLKNATGYRVYVYNYATKKWTAYGNTSKNYITINSLNAGQSYAVKIKAFYRTGTTVLYTPNDSTRGYSTTIAVATKPPYVRNIEVTATYTNGFFLSWSASRGATGYLVYISEKKDSGYKLATRCNGDTGAVVLGLTKGKTYYVKVRPYKRLSTKPVQYVYGYFGNAVKVTI